MRSAKTRTPSRVAAETRQIPHGLYGQTLQHYDAFRDLIYGTNDGCSRVLTSRISCSPAVPPAGTVCQRIRQGR